MSEASTVCSMPEQINSDIFMMYFTTIDMSYGTAQNLNSLGKHY